MVIDSFTNSLAQPLRPIGAVRSSPRCRLDGLGSTTARMVVPLGKKPARIDCARLYELELARMKREIELLKMAAG